MPELADTFVNFPVLTGTYANMILNQYYANGVYSCGAPFLALATSHLYYACRKSGTIKNRWEDMEFFAHAVNSGPCSLGLQDLEQTSGSVVSCAKQFGIALGVPLTEYSREQKRKRGQLERAPLPSLATMLKKRPQLAPCTTWIMTVYHRHLISRDQSITRGKALKHAMAKVFTLLSSVTKCKVNDELVSQWEACRKLQPTELLSVLRTAMMSDDEKLAFDYHSFLLQCRGIMQWVIDTMADAGRAILSEGPLDLAISQLEREDQASSRSIVMDTVDDILWMSALAQDHNIPDAPLVIIGEHIDDVVQQRGPSYHLDDAKNFARTLLRTCRDKNAEERAQSVPQRRADLSNVRATIVGSRLTMTGLETADLRENMAASDTGEYIGEVSEHAADLPAPLGYLPPCVEDCQEDEDAQEGVGVSPVIAQETEDCAGYNGTKRRASDSL
ncbi:hypothetical protein CLAFUW4_07739 [Fulvia fulva]|uniref:Uncharacterized protein n=1 Tax=Passalora fulva TaxID=5499 RepID=A0A9Q8LDZ6_PASFU|nr:uncharacterized protein CLAFUR5_07867 [Fulvia fulva]KAK4629621.1 hypothetical protein CLAFUR4_07744 [Fulvia fulva]KAK4630085.1 hypothetical protein CLAFUR0_07742 [Fulvia fulva]UJO15663.1 hypothetical protein CLAFUR5_07867 [Fulvia fulva]WPV12573.1 hypothetical protein CLAFUW4_07739 [Fulvia fulva]WPV27183.1 hypothetical protein CLAFUW7_07740 [Fulvia fulva]